MDHRNSPQTFRLAPKRGLVAPIDYCSRCFVIIIVMLHNILIGIHATGSIAVIVLEFLNNYFVKLNVKITREVKRYVAGYPISIV